MLLYFANQGQQFLHLLVFNEEIEWRTVLIRINFFMTG